MLSCEADWARIESRGRARVGPRPVDGSLRGLSREAERPSPGRRQSEKMSRKVDRGSPSSEGRPRRCGRGPPSSEGERSRERRRSEGEMGKQPVRMKAVVYALSPFQQKIRTGLWNDLPNKIHHKISENWISAALLLAPLVGTYTYVQNYKEKEKLEHRY